MGTAGSSMVDGIRILGESATDESIEDLVFTLGQAKKIYDISTSVHSSLSNAAVSRLFSDHCNSIASIFSSEHDDKDDGNDEKNYASNADNESAPSVSGNYLHEWIPQYSSSLSIFATLSSGNFLSENEITEIFSRYGNIKEVKWIQISDNNGYLIVFSNEIEKKNAIKVCGKKMETKGRILKLWSFKQARIVVNNKLSVDDARNCTSNQSMKDKDDSDPYVVDRVKLPEFTNTFRSDTNSGDVSKCQIPYHSNTSSMTLEENMPSPERPGTRPSPATAFLLKQISEANMLETGQFYERILYDSGSQKNRFLNLPAPYHLLPDTPYFRRAPIVPPPTRSLSTTEQMPIQQRIINRYLASMKIDDENGFAAIAQYERECYEHLYATSYFLPQQQRFGLTINGGKHVLSTNFIGHSMVRHRTEICTNLKNSTNSYWSTPLLSTNQSNCAPFWRRNSVSNNSV